MMNFDPFAQLSRGLEMFQKMQQESIARATETLAYSAQLNAEWHKLTLETFKSATAAFAPKTAA